MGININRLLETTKRTSLIGRNIYTFDGYEKNGKWLPPLSGFRQWPGEGKNTAFGVCIGHPIANVYEAAYPEFYEKDKKLNFSSVRHCWTPAWQKTYYRSEADASYYPHTGCISFCETKCITEADVFCARIVLCSDKRIPTEISVKIHAPLGGEQAFDIDVGALHGKIHTKGFGAVKNSVSAENTFSVIVPPNGKVTFSYAFAFSKNSMKEAEKAVTVTLKKEDPFSENEKFFNAYINEIAPVLETENTDILKIYYYRWFLLYRALHTPASVIDGHPLQRQCFYESPYGQWFACPVGLAVPHHIEEAKWMRRHSAVFDDALNWIEDKTDYHHYIQYTPLAVWHLYRNHPDREFLEKAFPACVAYTMGQFHHEAEGLAFFPALNTSWLTGAEYQPAFYQHTKTKWDWTQDAEGIRKGIATEKLSVYRLDNIVYAIGNVIGCMRMAEILGKSEKADAFKNLLDRSLALLKMHFWSEERKCFVSIDAKTGKKCDGAVCYDSFMPYLWGIIGAEYEEGLSLLFSENGLAAPFGITTVEKECPMYWFDNCITGPVKSSTKEPHAYSCCWNGPVWPYAISIVAEALGGISVENEEFREKWMDLFGKYTELHFIDGDRATPLITEHYCSTDGRSFSKTCDYFHSTWIDLFMKYWAGIQVHENGIDILPFTKEDFTLQNVKVGGKSYTISQKNGKITYEQKEL